MNRYGSAQIPDYVPDEWQFRYGDAPDRGELGESDDDEFRARATAIRLLIWSGAVTAAAVAVMWPAIHLPRLLAAVAFVALGVAALFALARWVPDAHGGRTTNGLAAPPGDD